MIDKLDKKWVGFLIGAGFPAFCFFCFWLFVHHQLSFPQGFIRYLKAGDMLQEVGIACIVANLVVFYLFLNKKAYDLSKGMMFATFLYVLLIFYVSLL